MRLTKQSGYAVRIVVHCALAQGELSRIADIAEAYDITKNNIAKTVPVLVRNGIIEGVRGRNGGIRLARPPAEISVGEIVRAIESTAVEAENFGGEKAGSKAGKTAPINRMLDDALEAFVSVLDQHSIEDMMPKAGKSKTLAFAAAPETASARRSKPIPRKRHTRKGTRPGTSM